MVVGVGCLSLEVHESVRLASRLHFLPADCLARSIALAGMLQCQSYEAKVFLGVKKGQNSFASHAWVELDGTMLGEPESVKSDFTALSHD